MDMEKEIKTIDMKNENLVKEVIMEKQEENKKGKDTTATTGKGGGLRFNKGKLRYDLVHPKAHEDMVDILTMGAEKYFDRNWENGLSWTSVLASLKRHIAAIEKGEDYDYDPNCPECIAGTCKSHSGRLHIAHAACNVHFLNAFYYIFPQGDDRPKRYLKLPKIGIDVDGVLADFTGSWNKLYPEISATPNSWYLDRKVGKRFEDMRASGTLNNFYLNIEPLMKPEDMPFEPSCYITSRPVPQEITEQWLDKYNFPARKVISLDIKQSKVEAAKDAGIEIFIDDSYENFVELNKAGICTYLYTAPWNKRYDVGHMRLNALKDLSLLK
jgi:hypothetical protein